MNKQKLMKTTEWWLLDKEGKGVGYMVTEGCLIKLYTWNLCY